MLLILGAIVGGMLVGLALGGSLGTLAEMRLRWWPLALLGLALQLVPAPGKGGDRWIGVTLLVLSYLVLLVFVIANIRLPGFWLIAIGFGLNALVIGINSGMPVSSHALREAYGHDYQKTLIDLEEHGGAKHHLTRSGDVLLPLTDVIPVGTPIHRVFSAADMLFLVGIGWVMAAATKGPPGRHRTNTATPKRHAGRGPDAAPDQAAQPALPP